MNEPSAFRLEETKFLALRIEFDSRTRNSLCLVRSLPNNSVKLFYLYCIDFSIFRWHHWSSLPMYFCTTYRVSDFPVGLIFATTSSSLFISTIPRPRLLFPGLRIHTFITPSMSICGQCFFIFLSICLEASTYFCRQAWHDFSNDASKIALKSPWMN